MHHDGLVELRRQVCLVRRLQVATPLELGLQRALGVALLQVLHRIVIADARERPFDLFQLREIAPNRLQIDPAFFEAAFHDERDEALGQFHHIVEFGVSNFGFDHPEFGEMAARLRFLRAKRWAKRIHLAQRHCGCFHIQLARLREKSFFVEIIDWE